MKKKLIEQAKTVVGLYPDDQVAAAAVNGVVIDRLGFNEAIVNLMVGAASGSPSAQGVSLKMQTGDQADGSDMADVSGATIAALDGNNETASLNFDLAECKRYIRAVVAVTFTGGTTPSIPVAVAVTLGGAETEPVS